MKFKFIAMTICMMTTVTTLFSSVDVYAYDKVNVTNDINENEVSETLKNITEYSKDDNSKISWQDEVKKVAENLINNVKDTDYRITGMQYALIDNGQVILSDNAGVNNKAENTKLTQDNMFGIGSVSKMFVTASVMKLVDEGKVNLDSPVIDYIPEFTMKDERYKKITVRMLLNHSSGLMGTEYSNAFLFGDNDQTSYNTLLKQLKDQRLKAEPGEFSVYCNDGFSLAQLLVEKVSGEDFTSYIHDNFTKPLDLDNIKTPLDKFDTEKLAKNYTKDDVMLPQDNADIIGAGGVYSNAEDLGKFAQILNKSGILSEKSIEAMTENEAEKGIYPKDNEGTLEFGLGWDNVKDFDLNRYGIKAVSKGGDTHLYHGSLINVPEYNISVAVLSSGGTSEYNELIGKGIIKQYLNEKGIIKDILPDKTFDTSERAKVPGELKNYSGIYMVKGGHAYVDVDDEKIQIYADGADESQKQNYYYTQDGYFTDEANTCKCKFVKEKNGQIYLRVKMYDSIPGFAQNILDYYQAQKVEDNSNLSESIKKAWTERNNNQYLLLNEKYTSQLYSNNAVISRVVFDENSHGYIGDDKITGENEARAILELPGGELTSGRDLNDIDFYIKDGHEYLKLGSMLCINAKDVDDLKADVNNVKIDEDGYAKWFKVSDMDDKQMTVQCPEKGAFAVYDNSGKCINYSLVSKNNTVNLKDSAYVVFMGDKGSEFKLVF